VTNVSCNGGSNGSVVITPSGGTFPYSITPSQTNLAAGSYNFTVTDANGCTLVVPITISEPTAIFASASSINSSCGNSNGAINLSAGGGISPYSFNWSNGATTQNISAVLQ